MATILLVRHGETDWNLERRWQGHADQPLNETGREQARALGEVLAEDPPEAIYSSDLSRARETADIVGQRLGLDPSVDPRLREIDVGEWSGLTMAEIELRDPEAARHRLAGGTGWREGETYEQLGERVVAALHDIAARHDGRILVVSHGAAMRAVWVASGGALDERPRVDNCHVHSLVVEGGAIRRID